MRQTVFARRNLKEMQRDPISYIFCVGFPIFLLLLFTLINHYTGGYTPFFGLNSLVPGIMVFSLTFVMLSMALLVSKDRTTSLLTRLFSSPMTTGDFILGYAVPGMLVAVCQLLMTCVAGAILGLAMGTPFRLGRLLLCIPAAVPAALLFVGLGILLGAALNDKAAPGVSSVFISCAGILSGAWMPLETMGSFCTVCTWLPFYPAVLCGRAILAGAQLGFQNFWRHELLVLGYGCLCAVLAIIAFRGKMYLKKP